MILNTDVLAGKWRQLRGRIQEQWGELTDNDLDRFSGSYDQLVGILQERYGLTREEAEREVDDFLSDM